MAKNDNRKQIKIAAIHRVNNAIDNIISTPEKHEGSTEIDIEERKLWRNLIEDELFWLDRVDPKGSLFRYFKKRGDELEGYTFKENVDRIKRKESHLLISDPVVRKIYKDKPMVFRVSETEFITERSKQRKVTTERSY